MEKIKIPWSKTVWFFDIDDTLIDTAGTSIEASEGIRSVFESEYGPDKAKKVQQNFNQIFQALLSEHQSENENSSQDVLSKIESCQQNIIKNYGNIKKWSREVFIKLAANQAQIKVSPDIVSQAANEYWSVLTKKTIVFPNVLNLLTQIKNHQRPIFLITSSDARLKMNSDGQFDYDPKYSESLKRKRIEILKTKGIDFDGLSIGDPEDKPHLDFFQKGINLAKNTLGYTIDTKYSLMFGDSFTGDLQIPKEKLNFGLVVLFQKEKEDIEIVDNREIHLGNISKIVDYLIE